ncbi:MAG: LacI family DNA-binding transcriptional regulator [Atopobiaceae bacterium]|jgi:LacI family sucrose operon transcriptional repressor|nr:LacI family DNA-binding transcriptional regulator [Atopobiaceae bacterium]MCI2172807.1 LacI family DNA-binding transcriptional regulator [Atopobiaceae bacterium]MCI2207114.1 LacI family DNA-binding transcriptional regulator [Atopobiaceae bacterium]
MNINEIARMAGVSRATVSRYLNDGYVSEEKRDAIRKVIERTGYVPSSQAQTLRTGKTKLVGVIMPKINSESVGRMVAGISEVLKDSGYQIILANTDNHEAEEVKYLKVLAEDQVDGIILIGTVFTPSHLKVMRDLRVPLVILGQSLEGYSCVYDDDYHSMLEMARLVLTHSHRPAFLGVTEKDESAGAARAKAFSDACAEAGIELPKGAMNSGEFTIDSGYSMAERVLRRIPDVDAFVCATDNIAAGAMACLRDQGRSVPGEVQVTGVGDSRLAHVVTPTLTTLHYYYRTSGAEAAKLLVSMMAGEDVVSREIKMGFDVVRGGSTL